MRKRGKKVTQKLRALLKRLGTFIVQLVRGIAKVKANMATFGLERVRVMKIFNRVKSKTYEKITDGTIPERIGWKLSLAYDFIKKIDGKITEADKKLTDGFVTVEGRVVDLRMLIRGVRSYLDTADEYGVAGASPAKKSKR